VPLTDDGKKRPQGSDGPSPPSFDPSFLLALPVTVGLLLVCVGLFVANDTAAFDLLTVDVRAFEDEPWRLFTAALLHGDVFHLAFNAVFLWRFGKDLEPLLGHVRFAGLVFAVAVISNTAEYALLRGGIGLSGVVYGMFTYVWVVSSQIPRFRGLLDRQTMITLVVWFFVAVLLDELGVMAIANVAHGAGALAGALLGAAEANRGVARGAVVAAFVGVGAVVLVGGGPARPRINVDRFPGYDAFALGTRALQSGDVAEATRRLEAATSYTRADAAAWWNLGIAYQRGGRREEAAVAFQTARELAPGDPRFTMR
jgi:membrane associated rhomboid family serine protease